MDSATALAKGLYRVGEFGKLLDHNFIVIFTICLLHTCGSTSTMEPLKLE